MNKQYDYLIVGAGLYGCTIANKLHNAGYSILIVDKRNHIGGNCYQKNINGIDTHFYGPHIFHTSYENVWDFITSFIKMNPFHFTPIANYNGKLFSLPFNLKTFYEIYSEYNPQKCKEIIESNNKIGTPKNLEEHVIKLVGKPIYETLIKGYTEKQWGKKCTDLSSDIIKRLPVRYTFDDCYFNDKYVAIPDTTYNELFEKLIGGIDVKLNCNNWRDFTDNAHTIIYTGKLDEYFNYSLGKLEYRIVRFETETLDTDNYQGCPVMNFTNKEIPYTRIIEHKWFTPNKESTNTVISKEYTSMNNGIEAYPINDKQNNDLYYKYAELMKSEHNVIYGGRLAEYKYYDMDDTINSALCKANELISLNKSIYCLYDLQIVKQMTNINWVKLSSASLRDIYDFLGNVVIMFDIYLQKKISNVIGFCHNLNLEIYYKSLSITSLHDNEIIYNNLNNDTYDDIMKNRFNNLFYDDIRNYIISAYNKNEIPYIVFITNSNKKLEWVTDESFISSGNIFNSLMTFIYGVLSTINAKHELNWNYDNYKKFIEDEWINKKDWSSIKDDELWLLENKYKVIDYIIEYIIGKYLGYIKNGTV